MRELSSPSLVKGWEIPWLKGEPFENLILRGARSFCALLPVLEEEFDSVKDLGLYKIYYRGRVFHTIQLFECRNLH